MRVLVVHGMFCTRWHTAELTTALRGRGFAAEGVKLPGRGGGELGLRDHVAAVRAAATGEEVALVGHSMGGLIALLAAADLPALAKLALLGCAPPAGVNGFTLANLPVFVPAVLGGGATLPPFARYASLFMNRQPEALRRGVYARLVREPRGLIRAIALPALDRTRASRLQTPPRCPTLVLAGAADRSTPPRVQRDIAGLLPAARYEELAEPDHYGFIAGRGSGETLAALADFLDG